MEQSNWNYLYDFPFYYKDLLFGKLRSYIQPWISTYYEATEIIDGIYISDIASACNKTRLKEEGITHILTAVLGVNPIYPNDFVYLNIPTRDIKDEDISFYLDECCNFIKGVLSNDGKVLIHCSYGISRSPSIVIAYLIKEYKYSYDEAYKKVKDKRAIMNPNEGFKKQLIVYSLEKEKINQK